MRATTVEGVAGATFPLSRGRVYAPPCRVLLAGYEASKQLLLRLLLPPSPFLTLSAARRTELRFLRDRLQAMQKSDNLLGEEVQVASLAAIPLLPPCPLLRKGLSVY